MNLHEPLPASLADALQRITDQGLSARARYAHVALLLLALAMAVLLASLLATEPSLPLRTQMALATALLIALCWVGYASWTLKHRHRLLAQHRIVAARMAVGFCALFVAIALGAAVFAASTTALAAALSGSVMLGVAFLRLRRAHRLREELQRQRDRLHARLQGEDA